MKKADRATGCYFDIFLLHFYPWKLRYQYFNSTTTKT